MPVRSVTRTIGGWGNFPAERCHLLRPERERDVAEVLASGAQPTYLARGLGRSYGDAALNRDSGVVLTERMDRLVSFDAETGVVECEAGVTYDDLVRVFQPRGWVAPVTPGTKFVTIGGAVAADVHGKNHHRDGAISAFVQDLRLMIASGDVLRCSRDENAEAFWATVGGMGLTGAILTVRLQLRRVETAYVAVDYHKAPDLDRALELFASGDDAYAYSVAWVDCLAGGASLGRSVLMRGNDARPEDLPADVSPAPLTPHPARRRSVPFHFPEWVLNGWSVKAFNNRFYGKYDDGRRVVSREEYFYPLDSIRHWNRMYGKRGFIQYQCVLPPETSRAGLVELLGKLSESRRASFLAVLKTFGPQGDGLLSFPRAGHTLALDLPAAGIVEFARELDRVVLKHGGRVYLAKDACLTRESFEQMYPNLGRFKEAKARLDPEGRFTSSLARRLGIVSREGA